MFIDAHCHVSDSQIDADRLSYLSEVGQVGILEFIQAGYNSQDWQKQLDLKQESQNHSWCLHPVFGLHPWHVISSSSAILEKEWRTLEEKIHSAVAVGETGLDFFRDPTREHRDLQMEYFHRHIELAVQVKKPLVLHVVRAHEEVLQVLKTHSHNLCGGIVHGFQKNQQVAKRYADLGFYLSLAPGAVLRGGLDDLLQSPELPWVLETDAPHHNLTTNPFMALWKAAEYAAQCVGTTTSAVMALTTQRVREVFRLSPP